MDNKEYQKKWRAENKERVRETRKRWEEKNRDKRCASQSKYYHKDIEKSREKSREKSKKRNQILCDLVMSHYGGNPPKCSCCGENEGSFLVLDHINGGGTKQRKSVGSGYMLFSWIVKNDFPEEYQVLCANCNLSKLRNNGICIHKMVPNSS